MKPIGSITLLCALAALAYGCDSDQPLTGPGVAKPSAAAAGVPSTEGLASPEWQQLARNFIMQSALSGNSTKATRVYAYLSVAQHDAVVRAEDAIGGSESEAEPTPGNGLGPGGRSQLEADRGAVAGASAAVLTYFDPADAQLFEDKVEQEANAGPGQPHPDFARGEAAGRQVGAEAIARAQTDGFDLPWTGTVPVGPGLWFSSAKPPQPPASAQLPGMRPFFLTSADQFRPAPPPAFGLPNHPSYPSAHSCYCGAAAGILSAFFPAKTDSLDAMVHEAGLARIYAGIHYRFDVDIGAQLGRNVARFAGEVDRSGGSAVAVR